MCLYDLPHIQSVLDPDLSLFVEKDEFLLLSWQGAIQAGPELASNGLVRREDEMLVFFYMLPKQDALDVLSAKYVTFMRVQVLFKFTLLHAHNIWPVAI